MSIFVLPNELLLCIVDYLEYADDASAFSRSCHLLYSLINPTLLPRYAQSCGEGAVSYAMEIGDHTLIQRFIENIQAYEGDMQKFINRAAGAGYTELVRLLQDQNINSVHDHTECSDVPLVCALLNEQWETARLLISRGADPDFRGPEDDPRTALGIMAEKGSLDSVRFLVEETGSELEALGSTNETPLLSAAWSGNSAIVEYLVASGADRRARDIFGFNSLFYAACEGYEGIVFLLVGKEEETDFFEGPNDLSALAYVAWLGEDQITKLLLQRVNIQGRIASDCDKLAYLLVASVAAGCISSVQLLLDAGSDPLEPIASDAMPPVNMRSSRRIWLHGYNSPLRQAAGNGHGGIVWRFLDIVQARDPSPLGASIKDVVCIASLTNQIWLLREILNSELVRQLDSETLQSGLTEALKFAVPHEDAVRLLLERGATLNKDNGFLTLYDAIFHGSQASVKLLLETTGISPLKQLRERAREPLMRQNQPVLLDEALAETRRHPGNSAKLEIFRALLESKNNTDSNFHPANRGYQLALTIAIRSGHREIVEYFLSHGFDPNTRGSWMSSSSEDPLRFIAIQSHQRRSVEWVDLFMEYGADLEASGGMFNRTPLMEAVY